VRVEGLVGGVAGCEVAGWGGVGRFEEGCGGMGVGGCCVVGACSEWYFRDGIVRRAFGFGFGWSGYGHVVVGSCWW
jgi:hypothetical protein